MKRITGFGVVFVILFGFAGNLSAKAPSAADAAKAKVFIERLVESLEPSPELVKSNGALNEKLGAKQWKVREAATEQLIGIGSSSAPLLERAVTGPDPEISMRARLIIKTVKARLKDIGPELSRAIDTTAAVGDKRVVAALIKLLRYPQLDVRYEAEYGLRRITGQCFGYSAYADLEQRTSAAAKWKNWWKKSNKRFPFEESVEKGKLAGLLIAGNKIQEVWLVDMGGKVLWSRKVSARNQCAVRLSNGNIIVSSAFGVLEECTPQGKVVWSTKKGLLSDDVRDIQRLADGNTLIADTGGGRVVELDRKAELVWQRRDAGKPVSAQRLPNGNTLVCLYSAGKVIEVTGSGKVVWSTGDLKAPNGVSLRMPTDAHGLPNGNVLITDYLNHRVIEINRNGKVVWRKRNLHRPISVRRLPNGRTVISASVEGVASIRRDGKIFRQFRRRPSNLGKARLAPAVTVTPNK